MSFRERWIEAIYRVATGSKPLRTVLTPLGALVFFSIVALFAWLARVLDDWLGLPTILTYPHDLAASLPILAVGLFLVLWCLLRFAKARGTPVPLNPPKELVDTGPYAVIRNPMLTGVFLVLFGIGVLLGSFCLMFVFTPLFIVLNVWELKCIEEPELEKRLGQAYVEYKKRAPRLRNK